MSECTHDCSSCGEKCAERGIEKEKQNEKSKIKKIIGVVSGKGGVGKSLVTAMLASEAKREGFSSAVLDADITGPSAPKLFGLKTRAYSPDGKFLLPVESENGVKVMSVNLLLNSEDDPVVWRGPVIAGTVKQFYTDVAWGEVDYMFVDMPPGTGDVPLTVFQSIPLSGIIVVTSPQELVSMIVGKAVKMAEMMNVPIIGLVENMSYAVCPDCGKHLSVFGCSHIDETAEKFGLKVLAKLPIDPELAVRVDNGTVEGFSCTDAEHIADAVEEFCK